MAKYLIMECSNWRDVLEDDMVNLDCTPCAIIDDYSNYNKPGFEIWEILSEKTFQLVKSAFTVENQHIYNVPYFWTFS